jgi:hypothetical protein
LLRAAAEGRRETKLGSKSIEERRKPWYMIEHHQWLRWLEAYDGPGGCGRSHWLRAAEFVYNHIRNPGILMYVAEAVDIDRELLDAAADAASASCSMGSRSSAIRRIVPWRMIECALMQDLRLPVS